MWNDAVEQMDMRQSRKNKNDLSPEWAHNLITDRECRIWTDK